MLSIQKKKKKKKKTTLSNIQSSVIHVSMSVSIEFDCFSSFDSSFD
ncbi:hypothetical protein HanPI659440_Chr14g0549411 [Helianthus annuus]|nr:hypothetical protein HanPI659440_Chr14g0549411 [Helianthus annuus]